MLTEPNRLQGFLYVYLGERMPAPILNDDGEIDIEADNEALERWSSLSENYVPIDEEILRSFIYRTEQLLIEVEEMPEGTSSADYMTLFYDAAKDTFNQDKNMIRTYFQWLYLLTLKELSGPRWGDLVVSFGPENFVTRVRTTLSNI